MALDSLLAVLRDPPDTLVKLRATGGLYVVGGYLRDAWYGLRSTDFDFATKQPLADTAEALAQVLGAKPFALGKRHGTIRLAYSGGRLDISALEDGQVAADIQRRDYTVNTLAVEVCKLGQGVCETDVQAHPQAFSDLESYTLRMVSKDNLQADPVRILRGYRICAKAGLTPTPETRSSWKELAAKLNDSAPERLHEELLAWFSNPKPVVESLQWCADDAVLWELFPALRQLVGCVQNAYHHVDVWSHTLEAMAALDSLSDTLPDGLSAYSGQLQAELSGQVSGFASGLGLTRLALMLHDIGKPPTRDTRPDGRITFYGHQQVGEELIAPELERLKFSNEEAALLKLMVQEHLRLGYYTSNSPLQPKLAYRFIRNLGAAVPLMVLHSLADCMATKGPLSEGGLEQHVRTAADVLGHYYAQDAVASPTVLLSGTEIMAELDLKPGPKVGKLKAALLEATATGEVETKEQAREFIARTGI